jgi:hypothetical protein
MKKYALVRSKFFFPEVHCRKLPVPEGKVCGSLRRRKELTMDF